MIHPATTTHRIEAYNGSVWLRERDGRWQRWDRRRRKWYDYVPFKTPVALEDIPDGE